MNKNLLIGILAFLAGAALSYIVFTVVAGGSRTVVQNKLKDNAIVEQPVALDPTITPSTTNPDENVFTSKALGFSFSYLKYGFSYDENDHGIVRSVTVNPPVVVDNKVTFGPSYASSLTMYDKLPTESLETAIKRQFLQNIPSTQCIPVRVLEGAETLYQPTNGVSYVFLHGEGCPKQFDFSNPANMFVSFSSQPNKFFYAVGDVQGVDDYTGVTGLMPLITAEGKPFWTTMKFFVN